MAFGYSTVNVTVCFECKHNTIKGNKETRASVQMVHFAIIFIMALSYSFVFASFLFVYLFVFVFVLFWVFVVVLLLLLLLFLVCFLLLLFLLLFFAWFSHYKCSILLLMSIGHA